MSKFEEDPIEDENSEEEEFLPTSLTEKLVMENDLRNVVLIRFKGKSEVGTHFSNRILSQFNSSLFLKAFPVARYHRANRRSFSTKHITFHKNISQRTSTYCSQYFRIESWDLGFD